MLIYTRMGWLGPHTFNMTPIGYWVIVIPVATVAFYFLLPLLF